MRQDVIDQGVAAVQAGEVEVLKTELGKAFDSGLSETSGGGLTQADVDAAVAAQKVIDDQALADAQAVADQKLMALQSSFDSLQAKELDEEKAVAKVQESILAVQASFDAIKALLLPPSV